MERSAPVRNPHTSTADLLTWKEAPPESEAAAAGGSQRPHQPSEAIRKVVFGGQVSEEEAESLNKRKPCSGHKWKEMTGSGIFAAGSADGTADSESAFSTPNSRMSSPTYQQTISGISQISFSTDGSITPKKPTSVAEMAKQRELSGTLQVESESSMKRQISDAKCKELGGHGIFGPPTEDSPRQSAARDFKTKDEGVREPAPRSLHTSVKVSNPAGGPSNFLIGETEEPVINKTAKKIYTQKFSDLTGNNVFKGDAPPGSTEKPLSVAKLKEMSGSDIFGDEKSASRDYFGGVRKPPGGESSITLV
ncbi:uncharacterized protein LOC109721238 [Ananas comosus]|uniref:Uncharacterized protein LOC109721238 n=1 Tax=Ananas comosus TaxID=4615 RepID=A0A6P5GG25_ANACO|nr:uncharacterized protein LOC109721238 [Ananas comosus]